MQKSLFLLAVVLIALHHLPAPLSSQAFDGCPVSTPTPQTPTNNPEVDGWSQLWFTGDDGEIWADGWMRFADGVKVGWRKPVGSKLTVTGQRLDGDAPPLEAHIPDGYGGAFQSSSLTFPTAGCWQIVAKAGDSEMTFVQFVYPKAYAFPLGGQVCEDWNGMMDNSAGVIIGVVEGDFQLSAPLADFAWRTVRTTEVLAGDIRVGERFELIHHQLDVYMEHGQEYLIFLWSAPGYHLRPLCGPALVEGETLSTEFEWGILSRVSTVAEVRAGIAGVE